MVQNILIEILLAANLLSPIKLEREFFYGEEKVNQEVVKASEIVVEEKKEIIEVEPVATETPVPIKQEYVSKPSSYDSLFEQYGMEYQVNPELLKKIARCESTFNPNAVNGPYAGMFQFCESTWISTRNSMGLDPNPLFRFNAQEAIRTAAFKISRGGIRAWPVCGK